MYQVSSKEENHEGCVLRCPKHFKAVLDKAHTKRKGEKENINRENGVEAFIAKIQLKMSLVEVINLLRGDFANMTVIVDKLGSAPARHARQITKGHITWSRQKQRPLVVQIIEMPVEELNLARDQVEPDSDEGEEAVENHMHDGVEHCVGVGVDGCECLDGQS